MKKGTMIDIQPLNWWESKRLIYNDVTPIDWTVFRLN